MKYKNLEDSYLKKLNQIAIDINYYSFDPTYRIIPEGRNDLKSIQLYYERLNYEIQFETANQTNNIKPENFKDFLYSHQMYGKINLNGDVINLDQSRLKSLSAESTLLLSEPAADAFNHLYERHKRLVNSNVITSDSVFFDIKPKKAFISPNEEHSKYILDYFNKFDSFINVNDINKKIINFKTFIKYFVFFYNQNDAKIVNKTEFIKTSLCSPYSTGLIVEIKNEKHGNDKKVYSDFLRDPCFSIFDTLTKQHGFVMDKHSPWRLTFDIAGINAQQYLNKYDTQDVGSYFDKFYYFTEYFNFDTLKINLLNLYNYIAQQKPTVRNVESSLKNNNTCIYYKETLRQTIQFNDLNKHISEEDLMKLYFYFKIKENNIIKTDSQFEQMFSEILTINKYNGNFAAFDYINEKCKHLKDTGDVKYTRTFF